MHSVSSRNYSLNCPVTLRMVERVVSCTVSKTREQLSSNIDFTDSRNIFRWPDIWGIGKAPNENTLKRLRVSSSCLQGLGPDHVRLSNPPPSTKFETKNFAERKISLRWSNHQSQRRRCKDMQRKSQKTAKDTGARLHLHIYVTKNDNMTVFIHNP
jgi:hypothetical protein